MMEDLSNGSETRNVTELLQTINTSFENYSSTGSNQTDHYWAYYYDYYFNPNFFDLLPEAYRNARLFMYRYLLIIMWVVSILGNSLVIVILTKKRNRKFSTSIYLSSLAFADICLNSTNDLLVFFQAHGYVKDPDTENECRYRNVFPFAINFITTWMLVVISIERMITVWLPFKVKRVCTTKVAYIVIAVIWTFFMGVAFLHERFFEISPVGCVLIKKYTDVYEYYISWILIIVRFLLPYFIIFTSSVIVVITLLRTSRLMKQSTQKGKRKSVNVVMFCINAVFLVTNAPYIFFYCFAEYTSLAPTNWLSYAYYMFWYHYVRVLGDLNSAVNFFVYFLVGSRFRAEVKQLLSSCFPKKSPRISAASQKTQPTRIAASSLPPCADESLSSIKGLDAPGHFVGKALLRQDSQFTM